MIEFEYLTLCLSVKHRHMDVYPWLDFCFVFYVIELFYWSPCNITMDSATGENSLNDSLVLLSNFM